MDLGHHTKSDDVGSCMRSWTLENTLSDKIERAMLTKPMDNTNLQTTLGMACHHSIWTQHKVKLRQALHFIIAIRQHIMSDDIGRDMPSSLLYNTYE